MPRFKALLIRPFHAAVAAHLPKPRTLNLKPTPEIPKHPYNPNTVSIGLALWVSLSILPHFNHIFIPIPPKIVLFPTGVARLIEFMVNLGVQGLGCVCLFKNSLIIKLNYHC